MFDNMTNQFHKMFNYSSMYNFNMKETALK